MGAASVVVGVCKCRAKSLAAVIGGGAVVTMAVLALGATGGQPVGPAVIASNGMHTGVTVTSSVPGSALATSMAVPSVKATFFGKS